MAVLAGDALLTLAFETVARLEPAETAVRATAELARAAGAVRLIGGQADDLAQEGKVPGACALDARMGVTASDEADAAIKRAMIAAAARTMILADHSKQQSVAPFVVATWPQVHTLVTDRAWPQVLALGVVVKVAGKPAR